MTLKSWQDLRPLAAAIYEKSPVGCCWHIVLDDGNLGDDSVEFCAKNAAERECAPCLAFVDLMRAATLTQRRKLYRIRGFGG